MSNTKYVAVKRFKNPADLTMYDVGQEVPVRPQDVKGLVATKRIKAVKKPSKVEKVVAQKEEVELETKEVKAETSEKPKKTARRKKSTYKTKQITSE